MSMPSRLRVNPLSRRPRAQTLTVAVRGPAGTGKSVFAASLAAAGLGRLCYLDVEKKGHYLAGAIPGPDGQAAFDLIPVYDEDDLADLAAWALSPPAPGDGRDEPYNVFAIDSWSSYFSREYRQLVARVQAETGNPAAKPDAEQLFQAQSIYQQGLRALCESGKCVVVVDQLPAKGGEDRERAEIGEIVPLTTSGLEYVVGLVLDVTLRLEGLQETRVFTVRKSNIPAFPIGMTLHDIAFKDLIEHLNRHAAGSGGTFAPLDLTRSAEPTPEPLVEVPLAVVPPAGPSLDEMLAVAAEAGYTASQVTTAARHYHGTDDLARLTAVQRADLAQRIQSRGKQSAATAAADPVSQRRRA